MTFITLPSGQSVPANRHDLKDIMVSLDDYYRYRPTSRQLGEIMMDNRAKRAQALKQARQRARGLRIRH